MPGNDPQTTIPHTCATCARWKPGNFYPGIVPTGDCSFLGVQTAHDFGCVKWEPREVSPSTP